MKFCAVSDVFQLLEKESSRLAMTRLLADLLKKATPSEAEIICNISLGQLHSPYIGTQFNMAEKGVVATLLPGTAFSLREPYARGRYMIDNNCAVALATDLNPGSCFSESIPLNFALATLNMHMTIEETITALTINGAAAIDRAGSIGSIDINKKGDVIVLEFPSYEFMPYHIGVSTVEKVIKDGKLVFDKEKE